MREFVHVQFVALIISGVCSTLFSLPKNDTSLGQSEFSNKIDSLQKLALDYSQKGEWIAALLHWEQSISLLEKQDSKGRLADAYRCAGVIYVTVGSLEKGVDELSKSLRISTELNDSIGIVKAKAALGDACLTQGSFQEAITHFVEGFEFIPSDSVLLRSQMLTREGLAYQGVNLYDLAFSYYSRSLKIYREANYQSGIAQSLNNIGYIYLIRNQCDSASDYFQKSITLYQELIDSADIVAPLLYLSGCKLKLGNYADALKLAQESYSYAKKAGRPSDLRDAAKNLSDIYSALDDHERSLQYLKAYMLMKDSLLNDKNKAAILNSRINFELEQEQQQAAEEKDNLKAIAALQSRNQQLIIYLVIGALVVALLTTFLLFRNFRQKKKSEQQLLEKNAMIEQQKQRAEKSEQFKSQFLANMSHEIRTPMTAVLGFTNLLFDENDSEKRLEYLSAIRKSSENLLIIINDVLDLSKLEAGKLQLEKVPFRIRDQLDFIYELFALKAESKGLQWQVIINADVPEIIRGDPARIVQVLTNLIGNAIKFTATGSVKLIVSWEHAAETRLMNGRLHFSIVDTGIGIPANYLDRIFESFEQADFSDTRKFGGTGLGLSISKNLASAMGGEIKVVSEPGKETVFLLILPCEVSTSTELNKVQRSEYVLEEDIGEELQGISIIVAEDNPYNQLLISDTLKRYIPNATIVLCNNGKEVISILKPLNDSEHRIQEKPRAVSSSTLKYDLILMDVQMPEMDGYRTTQIIRSDFKEDYSNIPIIALTASLMRSDIDNCVSSGMNGYVSKPFKSSALLTEIAKVLGRKVISGGESADAKSHPSFIRNDSGQLINLKRLEEVTSGEAELAKKYLRLFIDELPKRCTDIDKAIKANDLTKIKTIVHAMKPLFSSLGMEEALTLAGQIEIVDQQNDMLIKTQELLGICNRAHVMIVKESESIA